MPKDSPSSLLLSTAAPKSIATPKPVAKLEPFLPKPKPVVATKSVAAPKPVAKSEPFLH